MVSRGFCNHTSIGISLRFFIDARDEITVAESRFRYRFGLHPARHRLRDGGSVRFDWISLARVAPGFVVLPGGAPPRRKGRPPEQREGRGDGFAGRSVCQDSTMILPQRTARVAAIRTLHRTIQSVGATGGVYKGQGRSQRELMTRAY
ncbi:Senescence-associated protein [Quillaja saponaria]|uniref:Senescence-associated protein n=1 Tax=Quillaja saponaria TaxID=32244 RepID=A0AAD7P3Y2_QUISA|nr:Senescence-associated protein [Quillaja saponaria]